MGSMYVQSSEVLWYFSINITIWYMHIPRIDLGTCT